MNKENYNIWCLSWNSYITGCLEMYCFFADDETGHNHFFLDYSNGLENPKVKFLQEETDNVLLVATNLW